MAFFDSYSNGKLAKNHGFCSCILEWSNQAIFCEYSIVTGTYYKKHLKKKMLPAFRKLYPANDFYYIHDGARSNISKTVQLLERGIRTSLHYQRPMSTLLPRLKSA